MAMAFRPRRLVLLGQVDALGAVAAFDVEHRLRPSRARRHRSGNQLRRQTGWSCGGQAEERDHVACFSNVGGAVHRQNVGSQLAGSSPPRTLAFSSPGMAAFAAISTFFWAKLRIATVRWCRHALARIQLATLSTLLVTAGQVVLGRVDGCGNDQTGSAERSAGGHLHGQVVVFGSPMPRGNEMLLRVVERLDAPPTGYRTCRRKLAG